MRLEKVNLQNFKSVFSETFPIDEKLTVLVGANEHGKTNLLLALRLLDFKTPILNEDRSISKEKGMFDTPTEIIFDIRLDEQEQADLLNLINPSEGDPAPTDTKELVQLKIGYNDGQNNTYSTCNEEDIAKGEIIVNFLKERLQDHVFYFDTFEDRLNHRIPQQEVIDKSNSITNGLIKLAGLVGKEDLIFQDTSIARQTLLNGAAELTQKIKELWVQGDEDEIDVKLTVSFSPEGHVLNVEIEDINTYGDISTRSRGFLFFVSFILKYKEYHDGSLENHIFLIDEPGLFLHPRGQKDLLLYLESLSLHNQLVYTTHSPFMINRLNNFRVRVVSKNKSDGTKIDLKPYLHNWKSLRASLGMLLSDSFYYADNNLVVEGPSDRLYIVTFLKLFSERGWLDLDLNILSIIDSGGCSNVPAMAQIIKSEERPFSVLIDADKQADNAKKSLLKKGIPEKDIKQVNQFLDNSMTIEDLLPRKFFIEAVNRYIKELTDEGLCKNITSQFTTKAKSGTVDILKKFLKEKVGLEEISKLNIARHFEEIISEQDEKVLQKDNFTAIIPLTEWIAKEMNILLK